MCANEENLCHRLSLLFTGHMALTWMVVIYYFVLQQDVASFWHKNYDLLIFNIAVTLEALSIFSTHAALKRSYYLVNTWSSKMLLLHGEGILMMENMGGGCSFPYFE